MNINLLDSQSACKTLLTLAVNQLCCISLHAILQINERIFKIPSHCLDSVYNRDYRGSAGVCLMHMSLLAMSACLRKCCLNSQAGQEMSVGDYYQSAYKIKLNPNLPCLNVGASGKPTYVPAELATVKRGQRKLKLDERQQAQMIREAAIKPGVRTLPFHAKSYAVPPCSVQHTQCYASS